jgi:hypothetical protein
MGGRARLSRHLAEATLAHVAGDKVVQAYQRSDLLEQRRAMMQAWALFLSTKTSGCFAPGSGWPFCQTDPFEEERAMSSELPPARFSNAGLRKRIGSIASSYRRLTQRELGPPGPDVVSALWWAPQVIVAHGTEPDPIFFFGNRMALSLFEMTLDAFTSMPSRLSAEPLQRSARRPRRLIDDYTGIRISATGRQFRIERAIWNIVARTALCKVKRPRSTAGQTSRAKRSPALGRQPSARRRR